MSTQSKETLSFTEGSEEVLIIKSNEVVCINENGNTLEFSDEDKPHFDNADTGESVIEYTGMDTDGRTDRSWSKAIFTNKNGGSPLHYHNERTEIYYIIQGDGMIVIDKVEHKLGKGEKIMINPGEKHQVVNLSSKQELIIIVKCFPAWIPDDQHIVQV